MPLSPEDEKELQRIEKLFAKGFEEAAKDPDRVDYIRQQREEMIEPWEDALEIWRKHTEPKNKKKKASSEDYAALRSFRAAAQQKQQGQQEQQEEEEQD